MYKDLFKMIQDYPYKFIKITNDIVEIEVFDCG